MSSLSIRNMNWTMGQREMERDARETIRYETSVIRSKLTAEQYNEWWTSTPDDEIGFAKACRAKYDEVTADERAKFIAEIRKMNAEMVASATDKKASCINSTVVS